MTKFNTVDHRRVTATGPVTTADGPPVVNYQGGIGYTRSPKSEVYLTATTGFDITAKTFYEGGDERFARYVEMIRFLVVIDADWTYRFLTWLRTKGNIRTAALVGGVEAALAMNAAGIPGGRHMISTVLRRADEPGEAIAYLHARHGRKLPNPIKRGIGDAVRRLYNERALLKWDSASHAVRFADVLALTHPAPDPGKPWQADLFTYAMNARYNRADMVPVDLATITANRLWRDAVNVNGDLTRDETSMLTDPAYLAAAGLTWEDVLSALGNKVDKATLWRNLIPTMGFMALLRNLRNFDEAGLTDADVAPVLTMLADPDQVAQSKQLPLRFLSAYRHAPSLRWAHPLDRALNASVNNIPALPGRTLVLVDTSGSMQDAMTGHGGRPTPDPLLRWDAATMFGLALARRCATADVVSYSGGGWGGSIDRDLFKVFPAKAGESLLTSIGRWGRDGFFIGGGTNTVGALRATYNGHDRVVILTDEQDGGFYSGHVGEAMPRDRPLYTFNVAGYRHGHAPNGPNRLTVAGLTDAMFPLIAQVESGHPGGWPWVGDDTIPPLPTYPQPTGVVTQ